MVGHPTDGHVRLHQDQRLPADTVKAARKAASEAAALRLRAEALEAVDGPRYLVVHATGKRAKTTVQSGACLLDRDAFAEAASTLQAWPKAVLAIDDDVLFAATLVAGDPAAGILDLARSLDL